MQPVGSPLLTVDLGAAVANWKSLATAAGKAECAVVCKADAYGLGAGKLMPALARAGARTFFTATVEGGFSLRRILGPEPVIYVLNGTGDKALKDFEAEELKPLLSTAEQVEEAVSHANRTGRALACALHVDTGMNRLGLPPAEAEKMVAGEAAERLAVDLVISHLAFAEETDSPVNEKQRGEFLRLAGILGDAFPAARFSLAATAGISLGAGYLFDMVRPGIGIYGGRAAYAAARPVVRLEAPIVQIREIASGQSVGYGGSWVAKRNSRIATVTIGYADGLLRSLGQSGKAWIGGSPVPFAGRINMDMLTLDVTAHPNAGVGEVVEFLNKNYGIDEMAEDAGSISHEVVTGLQGRYPRHYIGVS